MKKYLLISVKYRDLKRGAYLVSERFKNIYVDYVDHLEIKNIKSLEDLKKLNEEYKRIIFITQVHQNYSIPINLITLKDINFLFYIRNYKFYFHENTCNNGFYYMYPTKIVNYIPLITDFIVSRKNVYKRPCLGFYVRNNLTIDSYYLTLDIISNIKQDIDIFTMGQEIPSISDRFKHVINHRQTFDNVEFFKSVTHYIYPRSKVFKDPLPYSLIEAVQNNIQIIIPTVKGRDFKDGIDDIIEVSEYHETFNEDLYLDNTNTVFRALNFKNFYLSVFDNNFSHRLDRDKYKTFSEWLSGEIL